MSEIQQITDYPMETLRLIIQQYKDSPNLQEIIRDAGISANSLEDAMFEIRDWFWLVPIGGAPGAEDTQLDILGDIFSVARAGMNDTDYRTAIALRGASRFSGTPEDIISILTTFYGATVATYRAEYPAGFTMVTDAIVDLDIMNLIAPAGVQAFAGEGLVDAVADPIVDFSGNQIYVVAI